MPSLFSLPKLRSRGRPGDSHQTTKSPPSTIKSNSRSVSVSPRHTKVTKINASKSISTKSAAATKSSNAKATSMSHTYSYDDLDKHTSMQPNSKATYTFPDTTTPSRQQPGYESDGNTSTDETNDEFINFLDRSPPKLEDIFLEKGVFGRTAADTNADINGNDRIDLDWDCDSIDSFQEWTVFDSASANKQFSQQGKKSNSEWESPPWRSKKNPKLVSPSPSQKVKLERGGWESDPFAAQQNNDNFSAWGVQQEFSPNVAVSSKHISAGNEGKAAPSSFGDNIFATGFDSGFHDDNDDFFSSEWNQVKRTSKANTNDDKNKPYDDGFGNDDMLWEASSQFFDEKKNNQLWNSPTPSNSRCVKASSTTSENTNGILVTPEDPAWSLSTTRMNSSEQEQHGDNVISFDTIETLQPVVLSSSSSRKAPPISPLSTNDQTSSVSTQIQQKNHRQRPSNGSNNLQKPHMSQIRSKKGSGSVGSNSSAVDQILESYRQKRLAKQQGELSVSAQSNSKYVPLNSMRKTPSNESLSRTINHLESSIALSQQTQNTEQAAHVARARQHFSPPKKLNTTSRSSPDRGFPQSSVSYSRTNSHTAVDETPDNFNAHRDRRNTTTDYISTNNPQSELDQFLLSNLEATIGPCGVAPDMESLSGRSNRSLQYRSNRRSRMHRFRGDVSVDSRASWKSFRSNRSNISQSALSHMSKESQSVANDLFRLEAQLAEVARQQEHSLEAQTEESFSNVVYESTGVDSYHRDTIIGAAPAPRPSLVEVEAPPGKLGILLAHKAGEKGPTHISAVRSESVLAGKVHVGDRFVSIDGENVSRMNSREITSIMARKADFHRVIVFVPVQMSNRGEDRV